MAATELISIGRRVPELRDAWQLAVAHPVACLYFMPICGVLGLQGTDTYGRMAEDRCHLHPTGGYPGAHHPGCYFVERVCCRDSTPSDSSQPRRCLSGILCRTSQRRGCRSSCLGHRYPQHQVNDPCLTRQSFTALQPVEDSLPQHPQ
jgi:hypothetical protein